jgi:AcrR family transcriptional regulator
MERLSAARPSRSGGPVGGARTGAGDPDRTLALLWRRSEERPAGRGPRRSLSVDGVVEAALALADAEGLDAVTMRRVAEALGVAPMTIYTYVPGKAELLDLMVDALYGRLAAEPGDAGGSWRARLEAVADRNRAMFRHHPWAAAVSTARPPLGPGLIAKYERELRTLEGLGLDDVEMDAALTFLLGFVRTCALAEAEARAAADESRMDDARWWEAHAPLLAGLVDPGAYPTAARVGTAAGAAHGAAYSPDHVFAFGLQRVLDGLGALIGGRQH